MSWSLAAAHEKSLIFIVSSDVGQILDLKEHLSMKGQIVFLGIFP
jgi:hypothetical protein